ncbi:hypothetical protein GCM10008922_48060 [Faecalicatena contorta]
MIPFLFAFTKTPNVPVTDIITRAYALNLFSVSRNISLRTPVTWNTFRSVSPLPSYYLSHILHFSGTFKHSPANTVFEIY